MTFIIPIEVSPLSDHPDYCHPKCKFYKTDDDGYTGPVCLFPFEDAIHVTQLQTDEEAWLDKRCNHCLQIAKEEMSLERAHEINSAMVRATTWYMVGRGDYPQLPYTLKEMIEANSIIDRLNDAPSVNGSKTIHITHADRAIASLYTLWNFQPCPADSAEPIEIGPDRVLCVLWAKPPKEQDTD